MSIFKGAGVAIVTPMKSDLEVNYEKLAELLEEQIAGKTDAIIINLMNCLIIIVHTVRMRSLSAERPENLQQCPKRNTAK